MNTLARTALALALGLAGCDGPVINTQRDVADATAATDATTSTDATATSSDAQPDAAGTVHAQFVVTVPPETPAGAALVIDASDPALDGLALAPSGATYAAATDLPAGATITWHVEAPPQVELTTAGEVATHTWSGQAETATEVLRWGPAGGTTAAEVAFVVTVPASTPDGSEVWISGNQPSLGDWNGVGVELVRAQGGRYAAVLPFASGTSIELKVTRGSWDTVEKGASGEEVPNHAVTASGPFTRAAIAVASWRDASVEPPTGESRIDYIAGVESAHLDYDRDVWVYLPAGYDASGDRRYPVLYMHDGRNLFDGSLASFGVEWQVDETADALIGGGEVEPVIIVGVDLSDDRMSEYTQSYDESEQTGGRADDYGRFLVEELKPAIDAAYRTLTGAATTGVAGSSLGGLVSMYFGLVHAETFGRLGVISPSVWWDDEDILDRVNAINAKLPERIWLDIGGGEGSSAVANTRALRDALVSKGWVVGQDLGYMEAPGAEHNESAWADRMDDILRFLYPAAR